MLMAPKKNLATPLVHRPRYECAKYSTRWTTTLSKDHPEINWDLCDLRRSQLSRFNWKLQYRPRCSVQTFTSSHATAIGTPYVPEEIQS